MPDLVDAIASNPPHVFVIQTRGPLVARDIDLLRVLATRTTLRLSFSVTTDSDSVRRIFEPGCAPISERWQTIAALQSAGIETSVAISPILRSRSYHRTRVGGHARADHRGSLLCARGQTLGRDNTRRSKRDLRSPRSERVAGSGVSTLDPRSHGGARERKGQAVRLRTGRIWIACLRREHTSMPRRLIIEENFNRIGQANRVSPAWRSIEAKTSRLYWQPIIT